MPAMGMVRPRMRRVWSARYRAAAMRVSHRHKTARKNPHPVKQQNVRMLRLQLEILLHHRGVAREVLINVFIHIDFTHFLILSSAHMAPGKTL
jgi:hypothetical protein